jgi:hypothetical protein
MPWLAVLVLAAVPAIAMAQRAPAKPPARSAAEEKREAMKAAKWPTAREVQNAVNRIDEWNKDRVARSRFRNGNVEFWPVDIGRKRSEERESGIILGKIVTEVESKGGLKPGQYYVFTRKEGPRWEVYYYTAAEVVEKSKSVAQNLNNTRNPMFRDGNASIHYWVLKFDW